MKYDKKAPDLLPGEPWFLLRARDALAIEAIIAYADAVAEASHKERDGAASGSLLKHAVQCQSIVRRFMDWQDNNKDAVRMPKPEKTNGTKPAKGEE